MWPNGWAIPKSFHLFKLVRYKWFAKLLNFSEVAPYGIKDERIRRFVLDSLQSEGRPLKDIFGRRGGVLWEFKALRNVVTKELGTVRQQTLVFHPRHDDQTDISNTMQLQRRLGGLVDVVVLDDSYHMVTLDRQRTLVVERSIDYGTWLTSQLKPRNDTAPVITIGRRRMSDASQIDRRLVAKIAASASASTKSTLRRDVGLWGLFLALDSCTQIAFKAGGNALSGTDFGLPGSIVSWPRRPSGWVSPATSSPSGCGSRSSRAAS